MVCYFFWMKVTCLIGTQNICIKECDKQTWASERAHVRIHLNSIKNANESLKQNSKKKQRSNWFRMKLTHGNLQIKSTLRYRVTLKLSKDEIVFCLSLFIQLDIHHVYKPIYQWVRLFFPSLSFISIFHLPEDAFVVVCFFCLISNEIQWKDRLFSIQFSSMVLVTEMFFLIRINYILVDSTS